MRTSKHNRAGKRRSARGVSLGTGGQSYLIHPFQTHITFSIRFICCAAPGILDGSREVAQVE